MIEYDPTNASHRTRMAMSLKAQWLDELNKATDTSQGGVPASADRITARFAKLWTDGGLSPSTPGAPRAVEGVEPAPAPEHAPPMPVTAPYEGPSAAELEAALKAESANVTSVERIRELRQMHAVAQAAERPRWRD
jgi:hypothetical protein